MAWQGAAGHGRHGEAVHIGGVEAEKTMAFKVDGRDEVREFCMETEFECRFHAKRGPCVGYRVRPRLMPGKWGGWIVGGALPQIVSVTDGK